ncbi:MAG TPA: efflux RND transporter periplasmic adaptor subunit [Pseudomonadales bacterium]|nr:efflux RND transporter periplasmic adaptor subunit [Pseudomonadales bacterium]
MKSTYIAAILVAAVFVLWLLSGQFGDDADRAPAPSLAQSRDAMLAMQEDAPTRVRARVFRAEVQTGDVVVRGSTEADRSVQVRAETSGKILALPVDKGARVGAGDLLCRIDSETRPARVEEAREAVVQARIEYEGALKLAEKGFQSETAIATAKARLAARRADLAQRELDLANTEVRAPFAGFVEERPVEIGDYLQANGICARIVDSDPMMLVGQVAERDIARLQPGDPGHALLITGETVAGTIAFVASTSDPATRTFRIEVAVPNPDAKLRAGITAEIHLPVERFRAHRIPSALLALDDSGELGVRIVDADNLVRFVNIDIVKDTPQGLWVTGLPDPATVITVGQELVTPGEEVDVSFEAGDAMPASAPVADDADAAQEADGVVPEIGTGSVAQPRARAFSDLPRITAAGAAA